MTRKGCYFWSGKASGSDIDAPSLEDNALSLSTPAAQTAMRAAPVSAPRETPTSDGILAAILTSLSDDKAEDLVEISLRGKSEMADHMVIANGRSTRQVAAMAEKLTDRLKQRFGIISKVEGKDIGDWVLIDTGDVIVHLFRPEVREFYQLEKMWMSAAEAAAITG
jgi:ribosome-associated protein